MELQGFESHDSRLAFNAISDGFWLNNALIVCRTKSNLGLPGTATNLEGNGIVWYDTGQKHILSQITFRNCGYRSDTYNQYDTSVTRGCGNSSSYGCSPDSSTWGFLTISNEFTPEVMQATKQIQYDDCGRRFKFSHDLLDTASGRAQNWYDIDGTASGTNCPTLIGSGLVKSKDWFGVDDQGT